MERTETITVRVPVRLKRALQQAAERDHRTLTSYLLKLFTDAAATQGVRK